MEKEHRLGVDEINLVKRRLKLVTPNRASAASAVAEIDEIYGLDDVSYEEESSQLSLAYDASRTCIQCIEDILVKYDVRIADGWWNHFKEEYYQFVDQNIQDNVKHKPFSCHKLPAHK